MTPSARAKDRAAKVSKKHRPTNYKYNSKTNRAVLRKKSNGY